MIILPGDIAADDRSSTDAGATRSSPTDRSAARPTPRSTEAAELMNDAERIAIHGGEGTRQARAEVLWLSATHSRRRCRSPTGARTCSRPTTHPAVGMTGLLGLGWRDRGAGGLRPARSCSAPTSRTTPSCPPGKTIIQVDDKPLHLGRRAAVDLGLVGDVGETLRALIPLTEGAHRLRLPRHDRQAPPQDGRGDPDLRDPRGRAAQGLRPEMVATALSDLAERRRRVHRRHRDVQRVGRPLPAR